jgi:hypothetical protein
MPPTFHSTPVVMSDDMRDERRVFRWALPASLVVHLVITALLILGLPVSLSEPQKDEAIAVDLVPPPKAPEKPKPEQKPKADPPPAAQATKPEKMAEAKNSLPPPAGNDAGPRPPSPAPGPVFQFGEKDAGPRESQDGNSAEEGSEPPAATQNPDRQDLTEPPALAAVGAMNHASPPGAPRTPAPSPADAANEQKAVKLQKAKKLFSRAATGNSIATTAMGDLPRGERVSQLCRTELQDQLLNLSPPYFPEVVPTYRPKNSTVIEITRYAFKSLGQWYEISYRCEVDKDAMKVVSFAFQVGDPIPRSEWKRRRLGSP